MTLPANGFISLTQVMAELRVANPGRAYPISLGDADVRALAGVPSGPISLTNLYGKGAVSPLSATGVNAAAWADSRTGNGTVTCYPSVDPAGGNGAYSYLWTVTNNPSGATITNLTSRSCTVSKDYLQNTNGTAATTLSCAVTSNGTTVNVNGITGNLSWDGDL